MRNGQSHVLVLTRKGTRPRQRRRPSLEVIVYTVMKTTHCNMISLFKCPVTTSRTFSKLPQCTTKVPYPLLLRVRVGLRKVQSTRPNLLAITVHPKPTTNTGISLQSCLLLAITPRDPERHPSSRQWIPTRLMSNPSTIGLGRVRKHCLVMNLVPRTRVVVLDRTRWRNGPRKVRLLLPKLPTIHLTMAIGTLPFLLLARPYTTPLLQWIMVRKTNCLNPQNLRFLPFLRGTKEVQPLLRRVGGMPRQPLLLLILGVSTILLGGTGTLPLEEGDVAVLFRATPVASLVTWWLCLARLVCPLVRALCSPVILDISNPLLTRSSRVYLPTQMLCITVLGTMETSRIRPLTSLVCPTGLPFVLLSNKPAPKWTKLALRLVTKVRNLAEPRPWVKELGLLLLGRR